MQLSIKTRVCLVSAVAAAVLAACGGGSSNPEAQSPQSAELDTTQLASTPASPQSASVAKPTSGLGQREADDKPRAQGGAAPTNNLYMVVLRDAPIASYSGKIAGYAATRPAPGQKINPHSGAVQSYKGYLDAKHAQVLAGIGSVKKVRDFHYALNGFVAELTPAQADKLRATKGVLNVQKDRLLKVATASTPAFLGLTGPSGFYAKTGAKGENVVIGMIDSGLWPESNAFTDKVNGEGKPDNTGGNVVYDPPVGWNGGCEVTGDFPDGTCNNKLIGARHYDVGWGGDGGITGRWGFEYVSPRDWAGHGTHTSSTAGGNEGVPITGPYAGFGAINGIAPRARIAMYKVCYASAETTPLGGCFETDTAAAVDDAVHDGVDVISFSVSGTADQFLDTAELAFYHAAQAGIFVSVAGGNDGPDASTVNHPSPWVTTVAAGTHNRSTAATVSLGNGASYSGPSLSPQGVAGNIINGADAVADGQDSLKAQRCYPAQDNGGVAVLDPAKVNGKIVVCEREGIIARVDKSLAVAQAGGVGMVLVNIGPTQSLVAEIHSVPTVHLPSANLTAVHAYASTVSAGAEISQMQILTNTPAPFTASFSSRGPSLAIGGNILKPDIMAPGVSILAAVAPPGNSGRSFDLYDGTSMATPHISGIAALFKQVHPDWSPMAIKSALMTTARDVLDGPNTDPDVIFSQGAGFVNPNAALDPGLVFDSNATDWVGFMCGTGQLPSYYCTTYYFVEPLDLSAPAPIIDPVNFNSPSIALGSLAGKQVITRKVTNVSKKRGTYTAAVSGLSGFTVAMSPSTLTISPGDTKTITLTFTRTKATLGTYTGGQLTLSDATHKVRVPVVLQPVALAAPTEVSGSYSVKFGYSGKFNATVSGMVPAVTNTGSVSQNQNTIFFVDVPAGTTLARFQIDAADYIPGTDLDLSVYYMGESPTLVGQSAGPTADEQVNLGNPTPGTYAIVVAGFDTRGQTQSLRTYNWSLGTAKANNLTVSAPAAAATAAPGKITLTVNKTLASGWWLGAITYGGTTNMPAPTTVRIDKNVSPLQQNGPPV